VSRSSSRSVAFATLIFGLILAACGSGSGSGSGTPAPAATTPGSSAAPAPTATVAAISTGAASASCPTAATVNTALGVTVPAPVGVTAGGTTTLPAGSKIIVCNYHAAALNVIIEIITNTDPTIISKFSDKFPVPYKSVSGVGDQARSFLAQLGGGKDNEGVVATQGSTLVDITATSTPATLAQVEALVTQLL
jgi:hypothetical protein